MATVEDLAAARGAHLTAMAVHRVEPLPAAEVREHTLALLALSARIAREVLAGRWVYATEALAADADPGKVATAMGLPDAYTLRAGLRDWAHRQVEAGLMSPDRHDEVLALVAVPGLPAGVDATVVAEMRGWLCECTWADVDTADIALMPDRQIVDAVERHWDGGLAAFLRDAIADEDAPEQGGAR